MERLNILKAFIICCLLMSCSSSDFYKKIQTLDKSLKNDSEQDLYIYSLKKDKIDIDKYIFRFLKKELKNTSNIYYLLTPIYGEDDYDIIFASVYDVDNDVYYYLENEDFFSKKISLIENRDQKSHLEFEKIINDFNKNKCQILKNRIHTLRETELYEITLKYLYKIDLKNDIYEKCSFKNVSYYEF
ncbi:hypothetical protein QW060_02685 [Myroides ceti]|uniref:Lipoprotein n=1 Tax=Paenimyroides ceti TaxID=395087 RepID=A0ABT8CPD0_9FLAO|nr:hypothetical protein [Paenimyroides ceti]MDN3706034.1 hypothetical protein [Paenimyroides ceti]